jgi:hypothetical protein
VSATSKRKISITAKNPNIRRPTGQMRAGTRSLSVSKNVGVVVASGSAGGEFFRQRAPRKVARTVESKSAKAMIETMPKLVGLTRSATKTRSK